MKRIASIQDISCLGRCSLTVALPVISALGVECAIVPTAVLSAHTAFPGFVSRDLTDQLDAIAAHWQAQHVHFDALYTGYIASVPQVQQVLDFFDAVQMSDIPTFITPARTITHIGFIFTFRSNIIQTTKITTRLHFVPVTAIRSLLPQNAVIRIEIPAAAIIATTAGLKDPSTPCSTSMLRYFK